MKKIFLIVAGLFILTSCASSYDSLAQTAPTCIKPDCSISSIHSHAW